MVHDLPLPANSCLLGDSALPDLADRLASTRYLAIIDENVARQHSARLRPITQSAATVVPVPGGEPTKTHHHAQRLYDALAAAGIQRRHAIVAVGGGATSDLAGFVAGTWMRGVRWFVVPTTTESAFDAALGGKTALNHPAGKNLIGVFHSPAGIFVDLGFIESLPDRDYIAGWAESVKHAALAGPAQLEWHRERARAIRSRDPATFLEFARWNLAFKNSIVELDPLDTGLRGVLNLGHTVGHALERGSAYELRHGECVALGLLAEARLSEARAWLTRDERQLLHQTVEALGLPTSHRLHDTQAALQAALLDKKNQGDALAAVLLRRLGEPARVHDVSPDELVAALEMLASD